MGRGVIMNVTSSPGQSPAGRRRGYGLILRWPVRAPLDPSDQGGLLGPQGQGELIKYSEKDSQKNLQRESVVLMTAGSHHRPRLPPRASACCGKALLKTNRIIMLM
ncbi:hypothetical protein AAFF_G00093910 [Aldrovandia affinis]|uniref:Uncharacterized protein n=1 Tax=Aldrovandia affinis TaxID=143900 RepID=A0AAD7T388_9TELE|nr:hypothetical protein AAFF_G00093910 [Aldrovandia affinis]